MKYCEYCGKPMERPRWSNGELDSTWNNRRFCSSRCYGDWIISQNRAKRKSGRKRAQRLFPKVTCEICGSTLNLQRHHRDNNPLNNARDNVIVVCQICHKNEHMKAGTWGIRGFKNRIYQELQLAFTKGLINLNV